MLRVVEWTAAMFALIILTGTNAYYFLVGVPAGITQEEMAAYEGAIRNVFMSSYLIVALLSVANWQKMILGLVAVWPVTLLLVIVWLSNFWSVDPELTYRRSIAITITTLMGVYLFVRFDFEGMLKFLTVAVGIMAAGSILWVIAVPDYGLHSDLEHAGAWRGIFFHKNSTGRVMVFGLAVVIAAWVGTDLSRTLLLAIGGMLFAVIIGTTSQTTLLGTLVLPAGLLTVRMLRVQALKSVLITLVVLTIAWHVALIGFATYDVILELLGRDPTLTGRTDIWLYAIDYLMRQPFTGYGYDAFWLGESSPGSLLSDYWNTPHSHNGWLQIMINLGIPAGIVMLLAMLATMGRAIMLARYYPTTGPAVFVVLVCFSMLTIGMSEPVFMEKHTFDWMLMVAVIGCARALTAKMRSEKPEEKQPNPQMMRRSPGAAANGGMLHGSPI